MTETKYYCDFCKKKMKLPLKFRIYKHIMDKNFYGNFEPVKYEVLGYEVCEACYKEVVIRIKALKRLGGNHD
ncbi:MAG: hypothetical protein J6S67_22955 [Methanobrevibacter sp.]|nr:hypothetical protein [Methanobrevibacter sp.]